MQIRVGLQAVAPLTPELFLYHGKEGQKNDKLVSDHARYGSSRCNERASLMQKIAQRSSDNLETSGREFEKQITKRSFVISSARLHFESYLALNAYPFLIISMNA
ncbi:MAG: hypothetical protein [Cressdnaviricota sp.]|nr:MAG: hypothetical protein [Cressdnaviricota sp.]